MISTFKQYWMHYLFYAFILIIAIFTFFYFQSSSQSHEVENKSTLPEFKGRGYCQIDAGYTEPVLYSDFLDDTQANAILNLAKPLFAESTVVTGSDTNIRKSQTAWLSKNEPAVKNVIERVCKITDIPFSHAEKMQVVKYDPNGFYNEHHDAACDDNEACVEFEKNGGQRNVTMLIYLNDNFEGGETNFPTLGRSYTPQKNAGLLFYSLQNDGNKCHPKSLHAGVPVKSGNKYICNVWLREMPHKE